MIVLIYGTTAEAIKFAPIYRRLQDQEILVEQWVTLQQAQTVLDALPLLGLPAPDVTITVGANGRPLASTRDTAIWLFNIATWAVRNRKAVRQRVKSEKTIFLVHGDTLTSVVGALLAKFFGAPSAHVEAGLRSGNWRHPFPEELDRRIVGKLAQVHYAPSGDAVKALGKRPHVIYTHGNTALDSLVQAIPSQSSVTSEPFGLVLLHRFELLGNQELVTETFTALAQNSPLPLVVVADDHAHHMVSKEVERLHSARITLLGKQTHQNFIKLATSATFVVTDSGGLQEEMAFLGTPTLVHRRATERSDGLGRNVILSDWSIPQLSQFLSDFEKYRFPLQSLEMSPSDIIVNDLRERGYGNK